MPPQLDNEWPHLHKVALSSGVLLVVIGSLIALAYALDATRAKAADVESNVFVSICGDGLVQPDETCDAGTGFNNGGYASSTASRTCEPGCHAFGPYCGDGVLQVRFGEVCDDGNNNTGDLCSPDCQTIIPALPPKSTGSPPVGSIPQVPGAVQGSIPAEIPTEVVLRGKAYPNSTVSILLDGSPLGSTQADSNADFIYSTQQVTPGTATFSFTAKDQQGTDSITHTVIFDVIQSAVTTVENIFIPPSLHLSSSALAPGDLLTMSGQSVPFAKVITQVHSNATSTQSADVDGAGNWAFQFDTGSLQKGNHTAKAYFVISSQQKSGFGQAMSFTVGEAPSSGSCGASSDLNGDSKVNLVDFSIFLTFWNSAEPKADFNCDNTVNLADFSIMLFNWTG